MNMSYSAPARAQASPLPPVLDELWQRRADLTPVRVELGRYPLIFP